MACLRVGMAMELDIVAVMTGRGGFVGARIDSRLEGQTTYIQSHGRLSE